MKQEQEYEGEGISNNNKGYNDMNALIIRLDTQNVLDHIRHFLEGKQERVALNKDGEPVMITKQEVDPKANPKGVYGIMAWLQNTVNTQVVQGNLQDFADLDNYVFNYRMDLAEYIMKNLINWNVAPEDYSGIIDMIMLQVKPFMSRLVKNKERESYANTIRHTESTGHTLKEKGGAWKVKGMRS